MQAVWAAVLGTSQVSRRARRAARGLWLRNSSPPQRFDRAAVHKYQQMEQTFGISKHFCCKAINKKTSLFAQDIFGFIMISFETLCLASGIGMLEYVSENSEI